MCDARLLEGGGNNPNLAVRSGQIGGDLFQNL
jgi:hypothetical protein